MRHLIHAVAVLCTWLTFSAQAVQIGIFTGNGGIDEYSTNNSFVDLNDNYIFDGDDFLLGLDDNFFAGLNNQPDWTSPNNVVFDALPDGPVARELTHNDDGLGINFNCDGLSGIAFLICLGVNITDEPDEIDFIPPELLDIDFSATGLALELTGIVVGDLFTDEFLFGDEVGSVEINGTDTLSFIAGSASLTDLGNGFWRQTTSQSSVNTLSFTGGALGSSYSLTGLFFKGFDDPFSGQNFAIPVPSALLLMLPGSLLLLGWKHRRRS